ncbi:dihydropteroate synthase [Jiulongibacter sp. NS-SX5]|uniref:dihydropteroate synthase n=1 Tax=Jiulongibacter sp. NS-SX5 TaxID=3463854 RepID=UPI004058F46F
MKQLTNVKGKLMDLSIPKIMGIVNVTPDSFYDKSRKTSLELIGETLHKMAEEEVDIFDIGGYSTRPGAAEVSVQEEIDRVLPAVELVQKTYPQIPISIDTFRSEVATEAVKTGAGIVNDVSGGNLDSKMFDTVAKLQVPYILMHMRGTPATMTSLNTYEDLVTDVLKELQAKTRILISKGVKDIIIDPGFGFSKNMDQNYVLLNRLKSFQLLGFPLLAGLSRKSMIWKKLNIIPDEALNATTALNTLALLQKSSILRVHDVRQAVEVRKLLMQNYL